jgi:hypothetical protein
VLAFSEHLLGLIWLTSPLQWVGTDPLAAHNIAFMASWTCAGVAAWTLGYDLARKIRRYITQCNKDPKPIRWAYADPARRITTDSAVTVH